MQMAAGRNCQMCMGNAPSASPERAASRRRSVALPVLCLERAQAWERQYSERKRCLHNVAQKGRVLAKSVYQLVVGARQILQCVGQIKIGSSAQALYQTPNFRRHGKPNGMMPVLSSSPTSKTQSSGASRIGSHRRARHDIPESLEGACN
jgi:hypothetical protein